MTKGRKKKTTPEAAGETPNESGEHTTTAVAEVPTSQPGMRDEPPFEPTGTYTPTAEEVEKAKSASRGQFRTWDVGSKYGYTRMTDEKHQRIVIQFDQKPSPDVITALRGAGFYFQPDYQGQKSAWVRRNDHEGRLQVEAIEKLIRDLAAGPQQPER